MSQPDLARVGQLRSDVDDAYELLGVINDTVKDHTGRLDRLEAGQLRLEAGQLRLGAGQLRLEEVQRKTDEKIDALASEVASQRGTLNEILGLLRAR